MSINSSIEWTNSTWNPTSGCTKLSPGCHNCYAERMSKRLKAMGNVDYSNGFNLTTHKEKLDLPYKWRKSKTIFVNSMSDLFHENVPDDFISDTFKVMYNTNWHRYQILTKRSKRLLLLSNRINWSKNIWMGVSIENKEYLHRIDDLKQTDAFVKFISFEPLLGPIGKINLKGLDWIIVGGESGPGARIIKEAWVVELRDQCIESGISFFFKQWSGINKKKSGRLLQGRYWNEFPKKSYKL